MRVAFLDMDHTLLAADSNQLWMAWLQLKGLVPPAHVSTHERFMDDYARGQLDYAALRAFRTGLNATLPASQLQENLNDFKTQMLFAAIAPQARNLLDDLEQRGLTTVLISATDDWLVAPVAQQLGMRHWLASCFGPGKIAQAQAWLYEQGSSLEQAQETWCYSDSRNDLPLLEAVMHPVAVDPDPQLRRTADARGWPVISLR